MFTGCPDRFAFMIMCSPRSHEFVGARGQDQSHSADCGLGRKLPVERLDS